MAKLRNKNENIKLRKSGIQILGDVPWGTHLCQFYETRKDLIEILVPYFAAGLRNNEYCMWVTAPPLDTEEAWSALQKSVPNFEQYIEKGQIEILRYTDWYLVDGEFDSDKVLEGWVEREKWALNHGFEGLRVSGNTMWLDRNLWKSFKDYEAEINEVIRNHRMIALCTYPLQKCTGSDVIEVIRNHESTLIRKENSWFPVEKFGDNERLDIIGETAGMVGHNLRNPLQVIVGSLYLVRKLLNSTPYIRKGESKYDLEELLQTVELQVDYMNKIVSDLEDYARPWIPQPIKTSLSQLINDTLSTITVPKKIEVFIEIEQGLPKLMIDPLIVQRVLSNLIVNALQAMPKGGRLTIRALKKEESVFINVQDTGAGIPEENMSKIFQPLFTTKSKGQGLGLAVCKKLVEAHGGSIIFESRRGRGSTFTVEIPLQEEV
ncbi:MAG: MEDS domain-containing protein [Candidatus Jordarchaeaceae archaeon]